MNIAMKPIICVICRILKPNTTQEVHGWFKIKGKLSSFTLQSVLGIFMGIHVSIKPKTCKYSLKNGKTRLNDGNLQKQFCNRDLGSKRKIIFRGLKD